MPGELRIYLGLAAGVGKTYAMLTEAHHRSSRGTDVVIGYVEAHQRANTLALIEGLEAVPLRTYEYRGKTFSEMDTEAVLARKPTVVLVDELAHTNAPGSPRQKRWEDIQVLLDAGIVVISTVNVQHLESVNDVVFSITGVSQSETVPDVFVRGAQQIELVDMTPEALRRRIAHGNVYPAAQIDNSLNNFFKVENLIALRELALLWLADRVEENLKEFRERHNIVDPWETRERVLVAVGGAPQNENLIRRAARMAMRSKGELVAVHVTTGDGLASSNRVDLESYRSLVKELGGRFYEVTAESAVAGILQVARAENATQIVLGASRRTRLQKWLNGSVVESVVDASGLGIDVHVISLRSEDRPGVPMAKMARLVSISTRRLILALAVSAAGLPLLTVVLAQFRDQLNIVSTSFIYLLFALLASLIGGMIPSLIAAVASFLLLNYYFTPPIHSFTIDDPTNLVTLGTFLVVALAIGFLIDSVAKRLAEGRKREARSAILTQSAEILLSATDPLPELLNHLRLSLSKAYADVIRSPATQAREVLAADGSFDSSTAEELQKIEISKPDLYLRVSGGALSSDDIEAIAIMRSQLVASVAARELAAEQELSRKIRTADETRRALLTAVSHDLRTPLATIRTASSALLSDEVEIDSASRRELLETIDHETRRLSEMVANLLDMGRLNAGSMAISLNPVSLAEVVDRALMANRKDIGRIDVAVGENLPQIFADPPLLERAVANLVENALSYAGDNGRIRLEANSDGPRVTLRVIDHGQGIDPADRERVFIPFHRLGDSRSHPGVGLGLAVAQGFVEAQGGKITIEETPGGGCTMALSIPVAQA